MFYSAGMSYSLLDSDSVFANLAAVCAGAAGSSPLPSARQSQRTSPSISSSLYIPSLMFLLWHPHELMSQPLPFSTSYNSYPNKSGLPACSQPASRAPLLLLHGLGCLCWTRGGDTEIGRVPPGGLEWGQQLEPWFWAAVPPAQVPTGGGCWCRAACPHASEKSLCIRGKRRPVCCLTLLLEWLLHHRLGIHD